MTLRGSIASFPLETVVQLLAATAKTGQLDVRSGSESGALGFAQGRLVSAVAGNDVGDPALGAIFALTDGDFEFSPWGDAPASNLTGDLNQLLDRAVEQRDKIVADRAVIADDRMRFRLSERAASSGEVRLSSDQWRTLLAVNGERDLHQIAAALGTGRLATLATLADLVRAGIVDVIEPAPEPPPAPGPEPPRGAAGAASRSAGPAAGAAEGPRGDASGGAAAAAWDRPAAPSEWERPASVEPSAETPADPPARDQGAGAAAWDRPAEQAPSSWERPAEQAPSSWERPAEQAARSWEQPAEQAAPSWEQPAADRSWEPSAPAQWEAPAADAAAPPVWDRPAEPAAEAKWWERGGDRSWDAGAGTSEPAGAGTAGADAARSDTVDERLSALSGVFDTGALQPAAPAWQPPAEPPRAEPAALPAEATIAAPEVVEEPKKKGGLFGGLFRAKEEKPAAEPERADLTDRSGRLAAFANALLDEFNNGTYGKGRIDDRIANLLMRVDEQADPIDRPLPIVDDRIDATALERAKMPDRQVAPYLALLVTQIYEDAERAFGKDKARQGYRSARQRVLGGDTAALGTDLSLPRV